MHRKKGTFKILSWSYSDSKLLWVPPCPMPKSPPEFGEFDSPNKWSVLRGGKSWRALRRRLSFLLSNPNAGEKKKKRWPSSSFALLFKFCSRKQEATCSHAHSANRICSCLPRWVSAFSCLTEAEWPGTTERSGQPPLLVQDFLLLLPPQGLCVTCSIIKWDIAWEVNGWVRPSQREAFLIKGCCWETSRLSPMCALASDSISTCEKGL